MGLPGITNRATIGRFYARIDPLTATGWADDVSMLFPTDQASEVYRWLGQTPAVREWIGGRAAKAFQEKGVTIINKTYESTIDLGVDDMRRDKTGQILSRIDELGDRVAEHYHKLLTDLIVTPGNAYDGFPYFGTNHLEGDSGTQINALTNTQVPALDVVTATNPTEDEMSLAIRGVVGYMLGQKDDQGEPMNANARSFLIMCPVGLFGAALAAALNPLIATGTGAKTNLLTNLKGWNFRVEINPRLATQTVFYVFRTDASAKPFIRQEELFETGSEDQSFFNNRMLFGVKTIRAVGPGYWQYASKATLS